MRERASRGRPQTVATRLLMGGWLGLGRIAPSCFSSGLISVQTQLSVKVLFPPNLARFEVCICKKKLFQFVFRQQVTSQLS